MSWADKFEEALVGLIFAIASSALGLIVWLVRRVLYNEHQIKLLTREVQTREELRAVEHRALIELHTDVREMRAEVRELSRRD